MTYIAIKLKTHNLQNNILLSSNIAGISFISMILQYYVTMATAGVDHRLVLGYEFVAI